MMKQALAGHDNLVLPIMPATARELRRLLSLKNTRNEHLQEALLLDPAATIALYRRVEQSRSGASATITDPAHAISMIGLEVFRLMLAKLAEFSDPLPNRLVTTAHAYSQAAHAAWYAKKLSHEMHIGNGHEIPTAALLQNPAVLALWYIEPDSAARASNAVRDGVPYDIAFSAELGEPLIDANLRLANKWAFPKLAIESIGDWDPFNRQAQVVSLADMLAQTSASGWRTEEAYLNFEILEDFLNMPHDIAASRWHVIAVEAAQAMSHMEYPLPAFELLLDEEDNDEEINDPRLPVFGQRKKELPPPATDLHSVLADIMRRMRVSAKVERAVFMLPDKNKTELKTRLALGGNKTDDIRRFKLGLKQKSLFSLLLNKQQSIWVRDENRAKFQALIPKQLEGCMRQDGFYAMSVFVNNKPLGILFADGGKKSEESYQQFRLLCREVSQALGVCHV